MSGLTESHVSSENNQTGRFVEAILNYFAEASEKPVIYTYEPSPGVPRTTGKSEAHSVLVRNARLAEELALDRQGFQLVHQETAVRDFYDRAEVEKVYYREIEALLKEATGAEKVVVFDHQVRNIEFSKQGEKDAREYVRTVLQRLHREVRTASRAGSSAGGGSGRRDCVIASRDQCLAADSRTDRIHAPPAVCDARSIDPNDFVPTDLVYRDKLGEVYRFTYDPQHRWYYFPRLERDEAILLKCYDSKEDGRARFSAHSAFDDPTSSPDAAPRESIEVRALVFWPADQ